MTMKLSLIALALFSGAAVVDAGAEMNAYRSKCCGVAALEMNNNVIGVTAGCFATLGPMLAALPAAQQAELTKPDSCGTTPAAATLKIKCQDQLAYYFCDEIPAGAAGPSPGTNAKKLCCSDATFNDNINGVSAGCHTAVKALIATQKIPGTVQTRCGEAGPGATPAAMTAACEGAMGVALCNTMDSTKAAAAMAACCGGVDPKFNSPDLAAGVGEACYAAVAPNFIYLPQDVQTTCGAPDNKPATAGAITIKCEGKVAEAMCSETDLSPGALVPAATDACCGDTIDGGDSLMNDDKVGVGAACFAAVTAVASVAPRAVQAACSVKSGSAALTAATVPVACETAVAKDLCGEMPAKMLAQAKAACCADPLMNDGTAGVSATCFTVFGGVVAANSDIMPPSINKACRSGAGAAFVAGTVPVVCEDAVAEAVCDQVGYSKGAAAQVACCGAAGDKTFNDGKIGVAATCFSAIGTAFKGAPQWVKSACDYPKATLAGGALSAAATAPVKCEVAVAKALCMEKAVRGAKIANGAYCAAAADCTSGVCTAKLCVGSTLSGAGSTAPTIAMSLAAAAVLASQ